MLPIKSISGEYSSDQMVYRFNAGTLTPWMNVRSWRVEAEPEIWNVQYGAGPGRAGEGTDVYWTLQAVHTERTASATWTFLYGASPTTGAGTKLLECKSQEDPKRIKQHSGNSKSIYVTSRSSSRGLARILANWLIKKSAWEQGARADIGSRAFFSCLSHLLWSNVALIGINIEITDAYHRVTTAVLTTFTRPNSDLNFLALCAE